MKKGVLAVLLFAATTACSAKNDGVLSIRAVNAQPDGAGADALARGNLLFAQSSYALALDAFRKAVRLAPGDANGLNGVAISYAAMGRHDLAREYFELALARAPQDSRIYRNFARSLEAQGLHGEAETLMASTGGGGVAQRAARPTLAQLTNMAARPAPATPAATGKLELERISLGEVRLRTTTPGLTAKIVSTEKGGEQKVAVSRLRAPIRMAAALQAVVAQHTKPAALASVVRHAAFHPAGAACDARPFRLPATGASIDLPSSQQDGATSCAVMAEDRADSVKRLSLARPKAGGRKDERG